MPALQCKGEGGERGEREKLQGRRKDLSGGLLERVSTWKDRQLQEMVRVSPVWVHNPGCTTFQLCDLGHVT